MKKNSSSMSTNTLRQGTKSKGSFDEKLWPSGVQCMMFKNAKANYNNNVNNRNASN